jgi:hypothetical protein
MFVTDLRQVGGFFPGLPVPSTNNTDRQKSRKYIINIQMNNKMHGNDLNQLT